MWKKIIADRQCPCCHGVITFEDYRAYMKSISGDGDLKLFSCPHCYNIVFTPKDHNIWSDGIHFLMILAVFLLGYVLDFSYITSYFVFISCIWGWLLAEKILPFVFVKFQCVDKNDVQKVINESHVSGIMIALGFFLFVAVFFGLFYTLVTETNL